MHRRTGSGSLASDGVASADSARRYQASILPVCSYRSDVAPRDVVLRVEHRQAEQHRHRQRDSGAGNPPALEPDTGQDDHQEDRAEQHLERHHEDPLTGEAVDLLVRPHPGQRRRHDHHAQRADQPEQHTQQDALDRPLPARPAAHATEHRHRQQRDEEQLPEAAARVLGVAETGDALHVLLPAEEHGELHHHEPGEQQDERADGRGPLQQADPPLAGLVHGGQVGRRGDRVDRGDRDQPAHHCQEHPAEHRTHVGLGNERAERLGERRVGGGEQAAEDHEHHDRGDHRDGHLADRRRRRRGGDVPAYPGQAAQRRERRGNQAEQDRPHQPPADDREGGAAQRAEHAERHEPPGVAERRHGHQGQRGRRPPGPDEPVGARQVSGLRPDRQHHRDGEREPTQEPADADPAQRHEDRAADRAGQHRERRGPAGRLLRAGPPRAEERGPRRRRSRRPDRRLRVAGPPRAGVRRRAHRPTGRRRHARSVRCGRRTGDRRRARGPRRAGACGVAAHRTGLRFGASDGDESGRQANRWPKPPAGARGGRTRRCGVLGSRRGSVGSGGGRPGRRSGVRRGGDGLSTISRPCRTVPGRGHARARGSRLRLGGVAGGGGVGGTLHRGAFDGRRCRLGGHRARLAGRRHQREEQRVPLGAGRHGDRNRPGGLPLRAGPRHRRRRALHGGHYQQIRLGGRWDVARRGPVRRGGAGRLGGRFRLGQGTLLDHRVSSL